MHTNTALTQILLELRLDPNLQQIILKQNATVLEQESVSKWQIHKAWDMKTVEAGH